MFTDRQLAEAALTAGFVKMEDLHEIVPASRTAGISLTAALSHWGLEDERITFLHAALLQLPYVRPDRLRVPGEVLMILPLAQQRKSCAIPLAYEIGSDDERLYVAMPTATIAEAAPYLSELVQLRVVPVAASLSAIRRALQTGYPAQAEHAAYPLPELHLLREPATVQRVPGGFLTPADLEIAA